MADQARPVYDAGDAIAILRVILNGDMADSAFVPGFAAERPAARMPRHSAMVRATHWIVAICFFALLLSGIQILISHPRFYWGETGNVRMTPLFTLPIPASRASVPTGYGYVLEDQNGWSRSLHFQAGWLLVFAGIAYLAHGWATGHFRRNLSPGGGRWSFHSADWTYNAFQRLAYSSVVFVLFPLMVWTGLAMSPGFVSAFPFTVTFWGGQQSARTVHFLVTVLLSLFVLGHVAMVSRAGFLRRTRAMITGRAGQGE